MRHLTIIGILIAGICIIASTSFAAPAKKQAKAPKIPASITVDNARGVDLTELSLSAGDKVIVSLKKPLAPGKKITLSLKGLKSCNISIVGSFADEGDASTEADICKDKLIRFVD